MNESKTQPQTEGVTTTELRLNNITTFLRRQKMRATLGDGQKIDCTYLEASTNPNFHWVKTNRGHLEINEQHLEIII